MIRGFAGIALMSASLALLAFSVHELLLVGTCASGGPYEVAAECPSGTAGLGLMIPGSIFALLIGAGVWAGRGRAPGSDRQSDNAPLALWIWTGIFWSIGGACIYALIGPGRPGPGGELGGLIVAVLFIPMGAAGFLVYTPRAGRAAAKYERRRAAHAAGGADPRTPPPSSSAQARPSARTPDAAERNVDRLTELDAMRRRGSLTQEEFEVLKRRLVGE